MVSNLPAYFLIVVLLRYRIIILWGICKINHLFSYMGIIMLRQKDHIDIRMLDYNNLEFVVKGLTRSFFNLIISYLGLLFR